jgi:predicted Fe-Mo cluster-binding NifX family protein
MRVAVSSRGPSLDSPLAEQFGRCPYFVIADPDGSAPEAVENPYATSGSGAGIQAARLLAERDASVVLTGRCGPNATETLTAAGITIVAGCQGTVRQALDRFDPATVRPPAQERPGSTETPPSDRRGRGAGNGRRRGLRGAPGGGHGRGVGRLK